MSFYAYLHCKPDGTPFYVGKGTGVRFKKLDRFRNQFHENTVKKYGKENILVGLVECSSESIAFDLERGLIRRLRAMGVDIANFTDGGEGVSGLKMSESSREKMRKAKLGKPLTEEHREKLRKANSGKTMPPSSREKVSVARRGIKFSDEHKNKLRLAKIGRVLTEDHKEKVRQAILGRHWITDGVRCKMVKCCLEIPEGWRLGRIVKRSP